MSEQNSKTLVKLENVNKIYGDTIQHHVLHDINLSVPIGSFTAIVGPSGSGKSTLLNLIGTLDRPTSGFIEIDGQRIDHWSKGRAASFRNTELGFIFQRHYLLPEFNVRENILMPAQIAGIHTDPNVQSYADQLIELIGLGKHVDKRPNEISGGQQQRVAVARALVNKPKLVLADEPGASLDTELTAEVYQLLQELNTELNTTILLITHEPTIEQYVHQIIKLQDGKIINIE